MSYGGWLLLLAVIMLVAGAGKSWLAAWFFYGLAGILVLAVGVAWRPARLLSARRRMNLTHADIDQEVYIEVSLTWERPVGAGWVLARDACDDGLQMLTPPGRLFIAGGTNQASFSYRVAGTRRGVFSVGPLSVSCGDLFGIAKAESAEDEQDVLTVYPRVLSVPPLRLPSNRPLGDVRISQRAIDDPTRMVGVRDYLPGDNLSRIHWKATARCGTLTSKIFEPSSDIEVMLVLNMSREDYPDNPEAVELACMTTASIAAGILGDRHVIGVESNGADALLRYQTARRNGWETLAVRPGRDAAQLPAILTLLARVEPSIDRPLPSYLTQIHSRLPWTSTLLLVTHRLSEEAATAVEELERSGFTLALIIVGDDDTARQSIDRAASLDLLTAWVKTEDQLDQLEFWRPGRE